MRWVERVVRLLACSTATDTSARSRLHHRHPNLSLQQPAGISHKGFLHEANRRLNRAAKKLHKAEQKLADCESKQDKLLAQKSPSLEQLEALPPCNTLKIAVDVHIAERDLLSSLVDDLAATTWDVDSADELVPEALELIRRCESLDVRDSPPVRPPPKPRKPKGPLPTQVSPRLPYKAFEGSGGVEIRVGRTAKDNDVLSCDPDYRDADDWWLHAAGCPGSHVIVRSSSLPTPDDLPEEVRPPSWARSSAYRVTVPHSLRPPPLNRRLSWTPLCLRPTTHAPFSAVVSG